MVGRPMPRARTAILKGSTKGTTAQRACSGALKAARDNLMRIHELEKECAVKRKAREIGQWLEDNIGDNIQGMDPQMGLNEAVLKAMVKTAMDTSKAKVNIVDKDNAFLRARIGDDSLKIKRLEARIRARDTKIKALKERVEELSDMNGVMEI